MLKTALTLLGMILFLKETHAGEKSLYDFLWLDPDKKVYVLQNKQYKKEHTFYMDLGYLANFTSKFQDTNGYAIRGGFFIHEEWGLEVFYNGYSNKNNDDFRNVRLINAADPFIRRMDSSYGGLVVWSPFYGKINTFNQIYYFDWSFGAGLARVNTSSNLKTVVNPSAQTTYTKETYNGAVAKTQVKFHLRENIHIGVEYMNTYYNAPGPQNPSKKLRTNTDLIFSVGLSF